MADSSASIGSNFSDYTGNQALGGMNAGVIKVDTNPIQQLAQYTFYYNRSKWEQKNQDDLNKINELAQISQLDPNQAITKDKDEALAAYNDLIKKGQEYAAKIPKNHQEKIQQDLEWKKSLYEVTNKLKSATSRSIAYNNSLKAIADDTTLSAEQKDLRKQQLEKNANDTDIFTPLPPLQKFDLKVPDIGAGVQKDVQVLVDTGNNMVNEKFKLFDPAKNMAASFLDANGIQHALIKKGSAAYNELSDTEKQEQDLVNASPSSAMIWQNAAEYLNSAVATQKKPDGTVDIEAIRGSNKIAGDILDLAQRWNSYANQKKSEIQQGYFSDQQGGKVKLAEQLNPNDYFTIDTNQPIKPEQLVFLQRFAKAAPDQRDVTSTHTGDATAQQRLAIESKKADADMIYKRAMAGAAGMKAKAYVDNIKQQMKLRQNKQDQDQMLESLFTRNLTEQPSLVKGTGDGQVQLKIDASSSLPMFTFDGSKPKQLIPIGATPIGMDGKPVASDAVNQKISHFEGGHFLTQYIVNGKPLSYPEIASGYNNYKKKNPTWSGSLDDFLKTAVQKNKFDVRIIGANGATDKQLSIAAQRAISNTATGKGETPVFSTNDNPPTDDAVPSDNSDNLNDEQ